ncbi:MAG: 50S ribosomal protein L13 [Nanoarchaeota archaeon]|jgi:large subunit ribosomal protein L13|nr:50S ribosomal protein L13 [Nanoarchaeota archaeon]|tara:strand:- start:36668 stop:37081 length:414 start_codon:yes stop_codon:yes gene_type:complete
MIIDAKNLILGRLGTFVAKQALLGEEVKVVNCQDAVIVGTKKTVLAKYKQKQQMGVPKKGPFQPKTPDRFVKRTFRGMLPYKKTRGREAFERIKCFRTVPETLKKEKITTLDQFNVLKTTNINFLKIGDICKYLGGK